MRQTPILTFSNTVKNIPEGPQEFHMQFTTHFLLDVSVIRHSETRGSETGRCVRHEVGFGTGGCVCQHHEYV